MQHACACACACAPCAPHGCTPHDGGHVAQVEALPLGHVDDHHAPRREDAGSAQGAGGPLRVQVGARRRAGEFGVCV
eukprot:5382068-Prymnesium_polylepis.1